MKLLPNEINSDSAQKILGICFWKLSRLQEASFTFKKLVANNPDSTEILENHESVEIAIKLQALTTANDLRLEESCDAQTLLNFYDAIELSDPCNDEIRFRVLFDQGCILKKEGFFAKASQYFDAAIEFNTKLALAYQNFGEVRRELQDYEEGAMVAFKHAIQNTNNDEESLNLARRSLVEVSILAGKYDNVFNQVEYLLQEENKHDLHDVFYWRGIAYLRTQNEFLACADLFKSYDLLVNMKKEIPQSLRFLLIIASTKCSETLILRGSYVEALSYLDRAFSIVIDKHHPLCEKVLFNRAICMAIFAGVQRQEEALTQIEAVAEAQNNDDSMRLAIAAASILLQKQRSIDLPAGVIELIYDIGICRFKAQQYNAARDAFQRILKLKSSHRAAKAALKHIKTVLVAIEEKKKDDLKILEARANGLFESMLELDELEKYTLALDEFKDQLAWCMTKLVHIKIAAACTDRDSIVLYGNVEKNAIEISDAINSIEMTSKLSNCIAAELEEIRIAKDTAVNALTAAREVVKTDSDDFAYIFTKATDALDALEATTQSRTREPIAIVMAQIAGNKLVSIAKIRELIANFNIEIESAYTEIENAIEMKRNTLEAETVVESLKLKLQESNNLISILKMKLDHAGLVKNEVSMAAKILEDAKLAFDTQQYDIEALMHRCLEVELATREATLAVRSACLQEEKSQMITKLEACILNINFAVVEDDAQKLAMHEETDFVNNLKNAKDARIKALDFIKDDSLILAQVAVDEARIYLLSLKSAVFLAKKVAHSRHVKELHNLETSRAETKTKETEIIIQQVLEHFCSKAQSDKKVLSLLLQLSPDYQPRLPFDSKEFSESDISEAEKLYEAGWSMSALKFLDQRRRSSLILSGIAQTLHDFAHGREICNIDEPSVMALYQIGWSPLVLRILLGLRKCSSLSLSELAKKNASILGPPGVPVKFFDYSKRFSLDTLLDTDNLPDEIDPSRKEMYLNEDTFEIVFGLSLASFQLLPKWKKLALKKVHKLI
eukprot:CAMPEP_0197321458 /NCGR_PEP_ID=MMETSP0891-20130614/65219_1 /TAXON_ID=44058 ORGANISM="Aureoumbra lagunensis, Strain CCMP1510" /NCGR_SAMPLE_ID=MMETSP0891 /ASSEMBLY_ACC=CAM_ASM_000534 /LENGTH=1014 /DNA_ID=CAMNT_0042813367 /DNA_START=142 /DNA_END=3186 /DNA_ORIENTATION=-